ncbi:MAG: LVIVD repeat-containing protein [Gaiellaceae bacterium]
MHRSRITLLCAAATSTLVLAGTASAAGGGGLFSHDALSQGAAALSQQVALNAGGRAVNFDVLGHEDFGAGGFNADVWGHKGFAYVGVWGAGPDACPATGVKVADIRNPAAPAWVSSLDIPDGTTGEDVVVRSVRAARPGQWSGDLAVVGIQACDIFADVPRGLMFFDVTNPASPVTLGFWDAPFPDLGCHEVDLVQAVGGRVLAACANPFSTFLSGAPEVSIVDATNPNSPVTLGTWTYDTFVEIGCFGATFAHSVRFFDGGRILFASMWDAGTFELGLANPAQPRVRGVARIAPPDEDGDNHSMTPAGPSGELEIINPEDFSPFDEGVFCEGDFNGWGDAWIVDRSSPRRPHVLGHFATPNAASKRTDGVYSVHNTEMVGSYDAFSSWYSDGIVWWNLQNPAAPALRGQFVPPAAEDPFGFFPPVPLVWGVLPYGAEAGTPLILASDINSGLWIVRPHMTP